MDFKDIYSQWESSHNEEKAIQKRMASSQSEDSNDNSLTINTVRRMNPQDELDLHGYKFEESVPAAEDFINSSYSKGLRKIRIITGKGLHSPGGKSIIRPEIVNAVRNHPAVREADFNPKAKDGGSGAIIIILKSRI